MAKLTGPLFGTEASGTIRGTITYRTRAGATCAVMRADRPPPAGDRCEQMRACLIAAKQAHAASPTALVWQGGRWVSRHVTAWPDWWAQWRLDHPECA